jgi:hypothetical protein
MSRAGIAIYYNLYYSVVKFEKDMTYYLLLQGYELFTARLSGRKQE